MRAGWPSSRPFGYPTLLVDEALQSVTRPSANEASPGSGRCVTRRAVVLVTHNLNEIRETCTRAIWLEKGDRVDGEADDVLAQYSKEGG